MPLGNASRQLLEFAQRNLGVEVSARSEERVPSVPLSRDTALIPDLFTVHDIVDFLEKKFK